MKIIKDKILNWDEMYDDCKFVRCYNNGARLKNCIWESGYVKHGEFKDGIWKRGIWKGVNWINSVWNDGLWIDGWWFNGTWKGGTFEDGYIWKNGWEQDNIYNSKYILK